MSDERDERITKLICCCSSVITDIFCAKLWVSREGKWQLSFILLILLIFDKWVSIFWRPRVWTGIGNVFGEKQAFNLRNNHSKAYRGLWEGKESVGLVHSLQERGVHSTGSSLALCCIYSVLRRHFNMVFLRLYNWRIKKFENLIDGEGEREVFWMVCRLLPPQVFITPFLQGIMGHRSGVLIRSSCIPHFACFLSHLQNQGPSPPLYLLHTCLCVCVCDCMCVHIWVCVCVPLLGLSPCVVMSPGLQFFIGKGWISVLGVTKGRAAAIKKSSLHGLD